MKKIVALLMLVLISGCAEKQEYEETVLAQMKAEKDLKDYKITPEQMTKCIVQTSSEKMPGLFLVDPERLTAYKNYSKMLKLNKDLETTLRCLVLRKSSTVPSTSQCTTLKSGMLSFRFRAPTCSIFSL